MLSFMPYNLFVNFFLPVFKKKYFHMFKWAHAEYGNYMM